MQKRTFLSMLVAGAVSIPLSSHAAWAPSGEVSVIVAYKAGSGTDVGARLLASEAEKFVGRPLVVNNVPGADGKIGWTQLSRAPPRTASRPPTISQPSCLPAALASTTRPFRTAAPLTSCSLCARAKCSSPARRSATC